MSRGQGQGQGQRQQRRCDQGRSRGTVLGMHAMPWHPWPGDAVVSGGPPALVGPSVQPFVILVPSSEAMGYVCVM